MKKPKIVPFAKGAPPRFDGKPSFFGRVLEILKIVRADRPLLQKKVAPDGTTLSSGNQERP
jgi:hypothetical protein